MFHSRHQAYRVVYIAPCLDSGFVKWTAAETAARGAIEGGQCAAARRGVCRVDGLVGGTPPAWSMRLRHSSTSSFMRRSAARKSVSTHWRVRLAAPPGESGFGRGETGLSSRSVIRARAQRWSRPAGWAWPSSFSLALQSHRSVYYWSKALYITTSVQNVRCTCPLGGSTWQSPPQVANGWGSHDGAPRYQHSPGARPGRRDS